MVLLMGPQNCTRQALGRHAELTAAGSFSKNNCRAMKDLNKANQITESMEENVVKSKVLDQMWLLAHGCSLQVVHMKLPDRWEVETNDISKLQAAT